MKLAAAAMKEGIYQPLDYRKVYLRASSVAPESQFVTWRSKIRSVTCGVIVRRAPVERGCPDQTSTR